jgi:MerR family mercuric resistance operon transcriptional regulator
MPTRAFTIRKLADAADVGVETVRYYQQRGLLAAPDRPDGGFREYSENDVLRLRFIKRAQALGFSLEDIAELVSLSATRDQRRVRQITRDRVAEIRQRVADLQSMAQALEALADCCAKAPKAAACPIIAALTANQVARTVTTDAVQPTGQHSVTGTHRRSRGRVEVAAA